MDFTLYLGYETVMSPSFSRVRCYNMFQRPYSHLLHHAMWAH